MKRHTYVWFCISVGIGLLLQTPALGQRPEVHWEMATWAPWEPDGTYQNQADSGEDWAYDLTLSHDVSDSPDGYVYVGYSTIESDYASGGDNYWTNSSCASCSSTEKGCSMPKAFKTDLEGNFLWYKVFEIEGWLYALEEISDGGFIGVGTTIEREADGRDSTIIYNPTSANPSGIQSSCTTNTRRNLYVVKFDDSGDIIWQYIYGLLSDPDSMGTTRDDEAFDVVEMPNGHFRIVGKNSDSSDETRATVLEIDEDGLLEWIEPYGTTGKMSFGRAIARNGNDSFVAGTQYAYSTSTYNHIVASDDSLGDAFVLKLNESTSPPGITFNTTLNNTATERHAIAFDVVYNDGDLFVSSVLNCSNCFTYSANGEGVARVYRVNPTSGTILSNTGSKLGTVKAFDLWATMAPTSDGSVVLVSTKQPDGQAQGCTDNCTFSGTDAFVAKINASASDTSWTLLYDADTSMPHSTDGDKYQECLYAIVTAPGGGYTIGGNNSSNYDDDYIVKFKNATSQAVDTTTVAHTHVYYYGPDDLTIGPSFVGESSSYVELIARNSITINGPFEMELGSEFEAETDPDFVGVTSRLARTAKPAILLEKEDEREDTEEHETIYNFQLEANYPNPFNPLTQIRFILPEEQHVMLAIFNLLGQEVARLIDRDLEAGAHQVMFDASQLASGTYLYRLEAGRFTKTGTMTVVK